MGAILDAVADPSPNESARQAQLVRDAAAVPVDIAQQVDTLLPITTPRLWIAIAGMVVLLLAGVVYAAGTPQITSVQATGRVVPGSGVLSVESAVDMSLTRVLVIEGASVSAGELLATGTDSSGKRVELRAPTDGLVWQTLASPGQALAVGEAAITLLPAGSRNTVLVPVEETIARGILPGQTATISGGGVDVAGVVAVVPPTPVPADRAADRTSLPLDPQATYIMVSLATSEPLPYGTEVGVEIVQSETNLLGELVSVN